MSGVLWNDKNEALSCDITEMSMSSVLGLLASRLSANCLSRIAVASGSFDLFAAMSFSNMPISSVSCGVLAFSFRAEE